MFGVARTLLPLEKASVPVSPLLTNKPMKLTLLKVNIPTTTQILVCGSTTPPIHAISLDWMKDALSKTGLSLGMVIPTPRRISYSISDAPVMIPSRKVPPLL